MEKNDVRIKEALKETLKNSNDYTRIKKQDLEAMIRFYSFHPDLTP